MFPAEQKHYRKGLTLGLTLAETFSVVVFILLLACAALLRFEQHQRNTAEAQRDTANVDLRITQEMLNTKTSSWGNADAWYEYARGLRDTVEVLTVRAENAERERDMAALRAAEADSLLAGNGVPEEMANRAARLAGERDSLMVAAVQSEHRLAAANAMQDSLTKRLAEAEQVVEQLHNDLVGADGLTPQEAEEIMERAAQAASLRDSLATARGAVGRLDQELRAEREKMLADRDSLLDSLRTDLNETRFREDTLRSRVWDAERERDDAVGRAEFRERQIEDILKGIGIDPPPCWMDDESNPEHIFRIELTDSGMRLYGIAPSHRISGDPEATRYSTAIEEGRVYAPEEFLRLTQPFYALGVSRTQAFGPMGCRFWIQPVDLTGDQKEVFQERQEQLWRRFWFRW